eukprot:537251_1
MIPLIIIALLFQQESTQSVPLISTANCDGITYGLYDNSVATFQPAGICESEQSNVPGSQMWICQDATTIKFKKWWNSQDCSSGSTTEYTPDRYWAIGGITDVKQKYYLLYW